MDTEQKKCRVSLDEFVKQTKRVILEYDRRAVILSEKNNPSLPEIMKRFDEVGIEYVVSFNGVPKEILNPYELRLTLLDLY